MRNNISLLSRANDVGKWLTDSKAGKVILDPGVLFSGLHAIIFSGSDSALIQGLGFSSLALTVSISTVRNLFPELNKNISEKLNPFFNAVSAPTIDSIGFPLFINGVVLSGIALAAFAKGDYLSGAISLSYAIANTDKGARISQENSWTLENLGNKFFNKIGMQKYVDDPSRLLKHTIYLPELWGSVGAGIYGFSHSGMAATVGAFSALVAVTAAAVNNGDLKKPAIQQIPIVRNIVAFSDRLDVASSDQVISRRFMKYASVSYGLGAAVLSNFMPAVAHGCAAGANSILEKADRQRQ